MADTLKIAIITGGSRGLGRSMVLHLARRGVSSLFTYISSAEEAEKVAAEAESVGARAVGLKLDTGDVSYEVPPGWTIATLLPLLNTSVAPGLERWDPDRWTRHRLTDEKSLPSPMLVTAFGHGRHSCPAQPFSLSAMTATSSSRISKASRYCTAGPENYLSHFRY